MTAYRWETTAPFYSVALLLVVIQFRRRDGFTLGGFVDMTVSVGRTLAEIVSILLGIGMIVGAFQATGLTGPLANELVHAAGNSTAMLLFMGALTSFIFGMGMTATACYIFLAVILAPALVQAGLNELAVHLFILYRGMVSFITTTVALGAFSAATLAGANPMAAGWHATRLGVVIYVIPFFFVLNPELIGQGPPPEVAFAVGGAFLGIWLLAAAIQGCLAFVGTLGTGVLGIAARVLLALAGVILALVPAGYAWRLTHPASPDKRPAD